MTIFGLLLFFYLPELDQTQPVAAQPVRAGAERRDGQVVVVDDQPGREAWEERQEAGDVDRGVQRRQQVREEAGEGPQEGRVAQERRRGHGRRRRRRRPGRHARPGLDLHRQPCVVCEYIDALGPLLETYHVKETQSALN